MCVVSMIGDDYWKRHIPSSYPSFPADNLSRSEFNLWKSAHEEEVKKLREELEAMKKLLRAAKIFDAATGQPDCEVDEKVQFIKTLAEFLGVDLEDILG